MKKTNNGDALKTLNWYIIVRKFLVFNYTFLIYLSEQNVRNPWKS